MAWRIAGSPDGKQDQIEEVEEFQGCEAWENMNVAGMENDCECRSYSSVYALV